MNWVDLERLTGHNGREARTVARSIQLGVPEYGAGYLVSRPTEVLLRRLLATSIAAKSGSNAEAWRTVSQLEDLPGDGILSVLLTEV